MQNGMTLRLLSLALVAALPVRPADARDTAIRISTQPQLLIDDYLIARSNGVAKVQQKPDRGRVVLQADRPWEQRVFYPDVIRDQDGRFRMYYNAGLMRDPTANVISLAESADGISFTKPDLSSFDEGGSPTNIVYRDAHGPSLVFDPADASDTRYRLAFLGPHDGMSGAYSPDGHAFTAENANPVLLNKADTQQSVVWDPVIGKWVWFTRLWEKPADGRPAWSGFHGEIRAVGRSESADFVHWSPLRVVIRRSAEDADLSDFYGLQVTVRDGMMIGLLWTSQWYVADGRRGLQRAQLVTSRDSGLTWQRVDAKDMFFDLGPAGSFDDHIVWPSSVVADGNRDLIYYLGGNREHGGDEIAQFPRDKYRLGVRIVGHDRFVSRTAEDKKGQLTTRLIIAPNARKLLLNARVRDGGYIRISITDRRGRLLMAQSSPVTGDRYDLSVAWSAQAIAKLKGRPIRLNFTLRRSDLYSFTFR
jgi:hypothetical protein